MPVYVRLARGIKQHFIVRRSEWTSTAGLLYLGAVFATPGDTLAFANLRNLGAMMPESGWAWLCLTVGTVRLIALAANGTFAHTRYGRLSPHVRSATAAIGSLVWGCLAIGVMSSPTSWQWPLSIVMGLFAILAAQDAFNSRGAIVEAALADRELRHGKP